MSIEIHHAVVFLLFFLSLFSLSSVIILFCVSSSFALSVCLSCLYRTNGRWKRIESMVAIISLHFSSSLLVLIETPISLSSHRRLCARLECLYRSRNRPRWEGRREESIVTTRCPFMRGFFPNISPCTLWKANLCFFFPSSLFFHFSPSLSLSLSFSRLIVNWSEEQC